MDNNNIKNEGNNTVLTVSGITKKYAGTCANNDISLTVNKGEILGLVGENGSGKTTLMRILTGIVKQNSGNVCWNDACVTDIGAVIEAPAFFPEMSAFDNVMYQAKLCGAQTERVNTVLKYMQLEGTGKKKAKNFSLGMKQRLGIAIALVNKPQFLILDEPTNGLDPQGIIQLRYFLKQLAEHEGTTILISSHILSELSLLATRYLFIHKGCVIQEIEADVLESKISQNIDFCCKSVNEESLRQAVKCGICKSFVLNDNKSGILCGITDYNAAAKLLVEMEVERFETKHETLESYYINLIHSVGGAK